MATATEAPRFATLAEWRSLYAGGATPERALASLLEACPAHDPAWISRIDPAALTGRCAVLAEQRAAAGGDPAALPLYGVPFAVKDNIDAAGFETTCACPAFAYRPERSAAAVARLEAAGAVVVGKTNLDQFATGLVGTRSPYGAVPNAFDACYIAGGSSSGSASVVARGLVPFALGTDTAGSGRVPAGFNNLVGVKPTRGRVSNRGVVPACRTLDCVGVFALDDADAEAVVAAIAGFDDADPFSRHASPPADAAWPKRAVVGVPATPEWFGDDAARAVWERANERLGVIGVECRPVDFAPLFETAALLYDGPWVAERWAAVEPLLREAPAALDPVVRGVVEQAGRFSAADAFRGQYRRAELQRSADALMAGLDGLLVPTTPTIYTIDAVRADPVRLNARLGTYTNFVNLLDWSAIALPAGLRDDGLPAGITLIAPAWHEARLFAFARAWRAAMPWTRGASGRALAAASPAPAVVAAAAAATATATATASTPVAASSDDGRVTLAVVGAHLSGMPLNGQLTERGATLVETTTTSADYRLYALPGTVPAKPGLLKADGGAAIEVELWSMPLARYGDFVALVPSPLAIGTVALADGRRVQGFVCEAWACTGAREVTAFGGWRAFVAAERA